MADDVNKPRTRPPTIAPTVSASSDQDIGEVMRRARGAVQPPIVKVRERQRALAQARAKREQLREELSVVLGDPDRSSAERAADIAAISEEHEDVTQAIVRERTSLRRIRAVTRERAEQRAASVARRFIAPETQEARVRAIARQPEILETALRGINTADPFALHRQAGQLRTRAAEVTQEMEQMQEAGAPTEAIAERGRTLAALETQRAVVTRQQQLMGKRGAPPGIEERALQVRETVNRAVATQAGDPTGVAGPRPIKEIETEMEKVTRQLKEFSDAFESGADSLESFINNTEELANTFENLEDEMKQAARADVQRVQQGRMLAQSFFGLAGAGINAAQQVGVDQPIMSLTNAGQIAAAQNEQFRTLRSAMMGDMSAFTMIESGAFQTAARRADEIGDIQQGVVAASGAAIAADAITEATFQGQEAFSAGRLGGGTTAGLARAGMTAATGVVNAIPRATDVAGRITATQSMLAANQAALQAQREIQAVPAQMRQTFFDFSAGVNQVGRFAGGGREALSTAMLGDRFQEDMMRLGIDPMRAAQLVGQGVQQQGAAFQMMPQLELARRAEVAGFGPMETTFARMGQLAETGVRDPETALRNVMEEAVARGMDTSKAISVMVDATTALAGQSGAGRAGIDVAAPAADLLGRMAQSALREGKTEIGAMTAAADAATAMNRGLTDRSVGFANMMRMVKLREAGFDPTEAAAATTMDMTTLTALRKGAAAQEGSEARKAAEDIARQAGLGTLFTPEGQLDPARIQALSDVQTDFLRMGGTSMLGQFFTEEQRQDPFVRSRIARLGLGAQATTQVQAALDAEGDLTPEDRKKFSDKMNKPPGETAAGLEDVAAAAAKIMSLEIQKAAKDFGGFNEFAKKFKAMSDAVNPETINAFSEAAAKAAEELRIDTEKMTELSQATGTLTGQMQRLGDAIETVIKRSRPASHLMDQVLDTLTPGGTTGKPKVRVDNRVAE